MTPKAGHTFTAGPVIVAGRVRNISGDELWCGSVEPSVAVGGYRGTIANIQSAAHIGGISNDEAAANAHFIAEAFAVSHETGLTPRQLAERCEELVAALTFTQTDPCFVLLGSVTKDEIAAILAKATAGGVL